MNDLLFWVSHVFSSEDNFVRDTIAEDYRMNDMMYISNAKKQNLK